METQFTCQKSRSVALRVSYVLLFFFSLCSVTLAQDLIVSGTVTSADDGEALIGVNIFVQGTDVGTVTDFNGEYKLDVPSESVLVFSYIGYQTLEVPVDGRTQVDVSLQLSSTALDEVVVVGYGSMERNNVTGSIATVDVEALEDVPVPNVVEGLRGQVPGLRVTRNSGQPGSGVTFRIRGTNSLGAAAGDIDQTNSPIIVIDGVPLAGGGNLAELNPDDIESINVLKDAAAASIYGSSGANGAVLITTKSGSAGKPKVSLNLSSGFVDLTNRIDFMNGDQYVQYLLDSERAIGNENPSINSLLDPVEVQNYIAGESVDWQDVLIRTGRQHNVGLSISGGSERFKFYLNGDAFLQDGIVTSSDYERYSVRFNGEYKATDWLDVGARVQLTKSFADETANAITEFNINGGFAPFIPISNNTPLGNLYAADGVTYSKFIKGDQFQINPLHRYSESILDRFVTRSYVNPYINVHILDGLTYTLNTYAENRDEFFGRFWSSNYADATPSEAQIIEGKGITYLVDNILNYRKYFGRHNINATAVYGFQTYDFQQSNAEAEFLPTDLLGYNAIGYALNTDMQYNWSRDDWGRVYLVGRLGYTYDDRYSVTFTVRRDGSSRFGPNNRWGTFPSVSAAWNIHNENFLNDGFFDFLKLRLSYGVMGNDRFPTYYYRAGTNNVQIVLGNETFNGFGLASNAPNPDLKWETSKQINAGVDFGLLDNRLSGSVDVYQTNTSDLLLFETIIGVVNNGYTQYASNVGETKSWGIDVGVKYDVLKLGDFTWNLALNWAMDRNEIVRLSTNSEDAEGNPIDNPANGWFIGQDIREIFNYQFEGIWQLDDADEAANWGAEPGDPIISDLNNDGVITSEDRTFLGNPTPDWYGGLRSTFSWKGLELSVLIESVQGVTRVNNYIGGFTGRNNQIAVNYWTPENPTNEYPRVGPGNALSGGLFTNAIRIQDASFTALRNVSLSYRLPQSLIENLPVSNLALYVRGNNLKYWTDYEHAFSPESSIGSYPITSTWIFGANITF